MINSKYVVLDTDMILTDIKYGKNDKRAVLALTQSAWFLRGGRLYVFLLPFY